MVVEVASSTIVVAGATVAAFAAAAVIIATAGIFDAGDISNLSIQVWDRFGSSDIVWVDMSLTYPGGPLEITGDINRCLVPEPGAARCALTNEPPIPMCDAAVSINNTKHGCLSITQAGSAKRAAYEGVIDIGFDAGRGDPLGYVVVGTRHSISGTVGVR